MREKIKQILQLATNAPSGDNSQPWEFKINNSSVEIFNLPGRDNEIFNYQQAGSHIAHGALIENICILCVGFGLKASVTIFPNNPNPNHTATIIFTQNSGSENDPLASQIPRRCTNRKRYFADPLTNEEKQSLQKVAEEAGLGRLAIIEEADKKNILGSASSVAEKVMLQYRPLHKAFFDLVTWNKKEQEDKKIGLYIKTMELKPPEQAIFKLFSSWPMAKILGMLKLPTIVARSNAQIYASSPAITAIIQNNDDPESLINTGRLLERLWLKTGQLGLSMQPIAGVLYLSRRLEKAGLPGLNDKLKKDITQSAADIKSVFGNSTGPITMLFRIGKADPPSALSAKMPPTIIN